jgi:transporter family protein
MHWIVYSLTSAAFWGSWAFFGKLALRHAGWAEVNLVYGAAIVILFGALLLGRARGGFGGGHVWALVASGLCGALGLVTFYLALDRGSASAVVPLIGVYPVVTGALAIVFLGESLTPIQIAGVTCAVGGVVLIGVGS